MGGSKCFMSPESQDISHGKVVQKFERALKSDIFSLGLVFYYVLTAGKHPFGEIPVDHEFGILHMGEPSVIQPQFNAIFEITEMSQEEQVNACLLIRWMLRLDPSERPTISQVKSHPMFWDYKDKVRFIQAVEEKILHPSKDTARKQKVKARKQKVGSEPDQTGPSNAPQQLPPDSDHVNPDATPNYDLEERIANLECLPKDFQHYAKSFTTIEELKGIKDKLVVTEDTIKEISDVFKMPTNSVNDLVGHIRNKATHYLVYTRKQAEVIGMGEDGIMDWKKFYDMFTKRVPHLLAHLYNVFWDDKKLQDIWEDMESKKRD